MQSEINQPLKDPADPVNTDDLSKLKFTVRKLCARPLQEGRLRGTRE